MGHGLASALVLVRREHHQPRSSSRPEREAPCRLPVQSTHVPRFARFTGLQAPGPLGCMQMCSFINYYYLHKVTRLCNVVSQTGWPRMAPGPEEVALGSAFVGVENKK